MTIPPSTRNGKFVESWYDAFNRGDIDTVLDGLAETVTWIELDGHPLSGVHHGPDEVLVGVFWPLEEHFSRFEVRPEQFIESTTTVVVEGDALVTSHAGTSVSIPFAHVCELERGTCRVTRVTSYVDTALLRQAVDTNQ